MNCRDAERLRSAYLDGELDDARVSAVRGHLRLCESCAEVYEEEGLLLEAAGDLDPIDPPPALWSAIQEGLAREEIADAERPRLWMWWQGARPWVLGAGATVAVAAALVLVFVTRSHRDHAEAPSERSAVSLQPTRTHEEAVALEIEVSDRRYLETIAELRELALAERETWSAEDVARFDARLAELEADAQLASAAPSGDVRARDPVYAAYQAQIDYLQAAAFGEIEGEGW